MKHYILFFIIVIINFNNCFSNNNIDSLKALLDSNQFNKHQIDLCYKIADEYKYTNFKQSLIYSQKGFAISNTLNDSLQIANGFLRIGINFNQLAMYDKALHNLFKANEIFEIYKKWNQVAIVKKNIGNVYWLTGKSSTALSIYTDAYKIAQKGNDAQNLLHLLGNLGSAYNSMQADDSALYFYRKACIVASANNDHKVLAKTLINIGSFYLVKNEYDSAYIYYKKVYNHIDFLNLSGKFTLFQSMSHLYLKQNNLHQAKVFLDSLQRYAYESSSWYFKKAYYKEKYNYEKAIGKLNNAMESLQIVYDYDDSIKTKDYNDRLANYNTVYQLEQKENEINYLTQENEIITLRSKQKNTILILLLLLSASFLIVVYQILKSSKLKAKTIETLNQLNFELKNNREELTAINEELSSQREELYDKNEELENAINKLQTTQNQLIHSEKLASIGILARGVAHEINNPLNYICAGLQILENELDDKKLDISKEPKNIIMQGINRIVKIVKGLDSFVQKEESTIEEVDIHKILDNIIQFLQHKTDETFELVKKYGNISPLKCYPDKLNVALLNILSNSFDALATAENHKRITIESIQNENHLELKIINSGSHIQEEYLNKVFDPFFTTKDPEKGTGLGLTTAMNLIKEHDGNIAIKNINEGVEYSVIIPTNL